MIQALVDYYEQYNANIHRGVYEIAARATDEFEQARVKVARFINADVARDRLGAQHDRSDQPRRLLVGRRTTSRPAMRFCLPSWSTTPISCRGSCSRERTGAELRFIPVDERGLLRSRRPRPLLDGCKLVAIAHVSNTLGTIAPLETIIPRAHAAGAVVLVDGAQGAPHLPVDVKALDADFYAFSGHKMLGPTGIGVLYGKRALLEAMPPFFSGGDMIRKVEYAHTTFNEPPRKFEAGTSNIADAIALRRRRRLSRATSAWTGCASTSAS